MEAEEEQTPVAAPAEPPPDPTRPSLALFAIYSATPLAPSGSDDATLEASKVLFFSSSQANLSRERKARLMGTVIGMADFARMLSPAEDAPSVRSLHSLKQRMVWLEPEKGLFIHAGINLPRPRRVRTGSTATTASGASSMTLAQGASSSTASGPAVDDSALLSSISAAYRAFRLAHGSLRRMLDKERGRERLAETLESFWGKWVKDWRVDSDTNAGFDRVLGGVPNSPMCTNTTVAQLAPLLNQFAASHSSVVPILLHNSTVLYLPNLHPRRSIHPASSNTSLATTNTTSSSLRPARAPPPPITEDDLLALVEYLASSTPPVTTIAVQPDRAEKKVETTEASEKDASGVNSSPSSSSTKWSTYYTLGLNQLSPPTIPSMPSMPTMPSIPSIPIPSMSTITSLPLSLTSSSPSRSSTPTINESSLEKSKSHWGFRNVNWTLGRSHEKSTSVSSVTKPSLPPGEEPSTNHPEAGTEILVPPEPEPNTTELPSFTEPPSSESDPILDKSSGSVDAVALAEAIDDSESLLGSVAATGDRSPVSELDDAEEEVLAHSVALFCGAGTEEDTKVQLRRVSRGPLTFALITLPVIEEDVVEWVTSRAARLLEAVESVLDTSVPFTSTYPYRHLIKTGLLTRSYGWPSSSTDQSLPTKAATENEIAGTLLDSLRVLESSPPALETFVRINTSEWVVSRRATENVISPMTSAPQSSTDLFVVLPAKVGKEGSLVDAGDELRRVDRAYSYGSLV